MNPIVEFIIIALAGSAITMTLSKATVFKGLREWLACKSNWLGKLISCPYCTSHYVNLTLLFLVKPAVLGHLPFIINYVVVWFALVTVSVLFSGLIYISIAQMTDEMR